MRKFLGIIALSMAVLWGCGDSNSSANTSGGEVTTPDSKKLKVALLTPGPVNDSGWSAMAYEGLKAIEGEMGAEVANQVANGNDIKEAMRAYAQKDFDLVFGHGFEYNEPGVNVAKDFPNTVFVSSSGSATAKNAGAIRFFLEESFYLAGAVAALTSKTGVVGMVGGPDVPSIKSTFKAFKAGAEAAKPGIVVQEGFTGSNDDVAAAKQLAEQMIQKKADVLIHQANAAAQGVFNACKEGKVWAMGANLNQNDNESGVVIASATIEAKPAYLEVAKLVREGKFNASIVELGMKSGAIGFSFNDSLKSNIPAAAMTKFEEFKKSILDGKLIIPKDKF
jgi:basic membrane protein A and related proteins